MGLRTLHERLLDRASTLGRVGLINPELFGQFGRDHWFYLISGRSGRFDQIIASGLLARDSLAHHVLFGDWDAIVQFTGTETEADDLRDRFISAAFDTPTRLRSRRVLIKGGITIEATESGDLTEDEIGVLNLLAVDFDAEVDAAVRSVLIDRNWLVGPVWDRGTTAGLGVSAFIGVQLQGGRTSTTSEDFRDELLRRPEIAGSLVELHELDSVVPFQFMVRLWCSSLSELDIATDSLALMRVSDASVKGTTLIVASSSENNPLIGAPEAEDLAGFKSDNLTAAGRQMFEQLPIDAKDAFDELAGRDQMRLLGALDAIYAELVPVGFEAGSVTAVRRAADALAREFIEQPENPQLEVAVLPVAASIEDEAREWLQLLVWSHFGRRAGEAQSELQLPTKKVSDLSLGRVAVVLERLKELSEDDEPAWAAEDVISRIAVFADMRNTWSHKKYRPGARPLEEATAVLVEAVRLAALIEHSARRLRKPTKDKPLDRSEPVDLFISHASEDKETVARPLFEGLRALSVSAWFDADAMRVGDSLRSSIDEGLRRSPIGVVVLSEAFFMKPWAVAELNAMFSRSLTSQTLLIPVWHDITAERVAELSPLIADRLAARMSDGIDAVIGQIIAARARWLANQGS